MNASGNWTPRATSSGWLTVIGRPRTTPSVFDERWTEAMRLVLKTLRDQQRREGPGPYTFQRVTEDALDTQLKNGYGHPAKPVGLIASSFRPSDDATTFPFLIPSNFFAVSSLRKAAEILAHGKPRRNAGRRIRNARRRGRRGAERTRRLRSSAVRKDLRFRGRRLRQPPADGRRQRSQPAGHGLSGGRSAG